MRLGTVWRRSVVVRRWVGGFLRKVVEFFCEVCSVPPEFLHRCQTRESYIAVAELLAALVPLIRHLPLVLGALVASHLDSMTAICALVKGNCKAWDLANPSMVYHALLTSARANAWFEWVPTASNPADGGSRVGVLCGVAKALNIPLTVVPFPECLFGWLESGPIDVLAQMRKVDGTAVGLQWRNRAAMERGSSRESPPGMSPASPLLSWDSHNPLQPPGAQDAIGCNVMQCNAM